MSKIKKMPKESNSHSDVEVANFLLDPSAQAGQTINRYVEQNMDSKVVPLIASLMAKRANCDIAAETETMLMAQAYSLNAIFNNLAQKAGGLPITDTTQIQAIDSLLRLGFKAQSQCKATLEALDQIKNPFNRAFIKQQNVAYQQQVNNGAGQPPPIGLDGSARLKNLTNELLENQHEQSWLDTRAPIQAGHLDPALETLGSINRPKDRRGKKKSR